MFLILVSTVHTTKFIQIPWSEICEIELEPKNQEEDWEGEIYMLLQDTRW